MSTPMNSQFFNILNSVNPDDNFFDHNSLNNCNYTDINELPDVLNGIDKGLSIVCFNIRSYFKNMDEFLGILSLGDKKFDVIILTETWLNHLNKQLCHVQGYVSYHCCRSLNNGGGVSIFIKDSLISESLSINLNNNSIECIGIRFKTSINSDWFNVLGIYRPPSGKINDFILFLEEALNDNNISSVNCIIGGDFNICLAKDDNNKQANEFFNLMHKFYFYCLITKPTRVKNDSASLLDHIWSNVPFGASSGILISDVTDHFPVYACFNHIRNNNSDLIKIRFRDFSNNNREMFKLSISEVDWPLVLGDSNNADIMTDNFVNKLQYLYNRHFPIKTKILSKKRLNRPWLSVSLIKSIRTKHHKYKQFKLGLLSKSLYKSYNNLLDKVLAKSKKLYYDRKFNSISGCISKTWKLINNILKPCNNNDKNIKLKYNNSEVPINEVADVFNNYFSTIGNKLKNNIPTCTNDFNNFLPNSLNNSIYITPTNYSEVSLMINKLKLNKGNINNPNNKIYKLLNSFISIPITLIFNCIVATGIYPKTL